MTMSPGNLPSQGTLGLITKINPTTSNRIPANINNLPN